MVTKFYSSFLFFPHCHMFSIKESNSIKNLHRMRSGRHFAWVKELNFWQSVTIIVISLFIVRNKGQSFSYVCMSVGSSRLLASEHCIHLYQHHLLIGLLFILHKIVTARGGCVSGEILSPRIRFIGISSAIRLRLWIKRWWWGWKTSGHCKLIKF